VAELDRAVARIVNHSQRPNWYAPWDTGHVHESSGSGFVIEGGLVMTNAHVVSDARMLLLYLHGDPDPHPAVVHAVGHDCDLALLRPLEPGVLDGRPTLEFGGLPRLRSTVETYGYPAGGRQISSTRGVVSRIELQTYSHPANELHLSVQTDAAINPGNSGGPVIQDGKVVGVAFQASADLQNVGYFIPTEVIHHFRVDAASPTYQGFPSLGARAQHLENPAARAEAGMAPGESGVIVDLVYPASSAEGWLEVGDVLLAMDGVPIANDGSVALPPHPALPTGAGPTDVLRVDLLGLVDRHQLGERLHVRVLRRGARLDLEIPLLPWPAQLRFAAQHDRRPRYFVHGGFVFVPLDLEMLRTFGKDWRSKAEKVLLYEYDQRPYVDVDAWRREQVVLLRRLDHPVNIGAYWSQNLVVERINGRPVQSLADLVHQVEAGNEPFHVFECAGNRLVVLDRDAARAANAEILERYGVPMDRNL
jgi:S1-C subfamily serine protease